jgi:hypothetical protein
MRVTNLELEVEIAPELTSAWNGVTVLVVDRLESHPAAEELDEDAAGVPGCALALDRREPGSCVMEGESLLAGGSTGAPCEGRDWRIGTRGRWPSGRLRWPREIA